MKFIWSSVGSCVSWCEESQCVVFFSVMFSLLSIPEEVVGVENDTGVFLMDEDINPESFAEEGSGWELGSLPRTANSSELATDMCISAENLTEPEALLYSPQYVDEIIWMGG